jgi:hypothetical protein
VGIARKTWKVPRWLWGRFFEFLTGEWWFWWGHPNGGTIIFLRSVQIAFSLWPVAVALRSLFNADFDLGALWNDPGPLWYTAADTIPWLGAIFFAVYAALYARFSSQWNYLAGTYNLLMQTQAMIDNPDDNEKIQHWKVALVEDAEDLHLATKPMFSMLTHHLLTDPKIGPLFEADTVNGTKRRAKLKKRLLKTIGPDLPAALAPPPAPPVPVGSQAPAIAAAATGFVAGLVAWRWWR